VVNAAVLEKYPKEFKYLRKSCGLNDDTDLSILLNPKFIVEALGCSQCKHDYLDHLCSCALQKDGNYFYTKQGCLNEAWSNVHYGLEAEFITKCNEKCGCPNTCSNLVVQRGMTHDLEVWSTPCQHWNYFALPSCTYT
jgi:hypothetical protein